VHFLPMIDPLFKRSLLAIEDSLTLRDRCRALIQETENTVRELRWAIHESACARENSRQRRGEE
jgi:hypothetical protein